MRRLITYITLHFILSNSVSAYEISTHQKISEYAYDNSILAKDEFFNNIGFDAEESFLGYDNIRKRAFLLMSDGSKNEDGGLRFLNHFYAPQMGGEGLTKTPGMASPDWVLEEQNNSAQTFSYSDAINSFYFSLQIKQPEERNRFFGLTIERLGHSVHHMQDMAQPQHVRDDIHCDSLLCWPIDGFYSPSLYEKSTQKQNSNLPFNAFHRLDLSEFTRAREIWGSPNDINSKGIAVYTSYNFLSEGTNFLRDSSGQVVSNGENIYPRYEEDKVLELDIKQINPSSRLTGVIRFYGTTFVNSTVVNPLATSQSVFDFEIRKYAAAPNYYNVSKAGFTLNRINLNATRKFLIPKAVTYSVGLIDYFFRGRLEITDIQWGATGLELTVHNISEGNFDLGEGAFEVYYDAKDGLRYPATIINTGAITSLTNGDSTTLSLEVPSDVDWSKENPFVLVFKGIIGEEQGIAAKVFNASMRSLVFTTNDPDAADYSSHEIYWGNGEWVLSEATNNKVGNLDWRGWYVNGMPTRVLSWKGPQTRYLPKNSWKYEYSDMIYMDGLEAFRVPGGHRVLGAALQKDLYDESKAWVVAVCRNELNDSREDIIFRRPATIDLSGTLYEPDLHPDGWEEIGRHAFLSYGYPFQPWFFNGDGTEAQTMRWNYDSSASYYSQLHRLKVTIPQARVAYFQDMGVTALQENYTLTTSCSRGPTVYQNDCDGQPVGTSGNIYSERHDNKSISTDYDLTGSNIVAVDYIDNQEVFLEYHVNNVVTEGQDSDYDSIYSASCEVVDEPLPVHTVRTNETSSVTDAETVTYYSASNNYVKVANSGNLTVDEYLWNKTINKKATSTNIQSVEGSGNNTYLILEYIDLRYGVVVAVETDKTWLTTRQDGSTIANNGTEETRILTWKKGITSKEVIGTTTVSFNSGYRPIDCTSQDITFSEPYSVEPVYGGYYGNIMMGIDLQGRIFYSYAYFNQVYNRLENGDVGKLLNQSVDNTWFSIVGIK
ncbi:MAG: hypothetical protein PVJ63_09835 [Thioalkalispiraceae bacterium]